MKDIYLFPGDTDVELAEVGGKGLSLVESVSLKLPVPPGFILTVAFFAPWQTKLKSLKVWQKFLLATEENAEKACNDLKKSVAKLKFTAEQKAALSEALGKFEASELFAVRSSSPNEDLDGASFAGGYETVLGVNHETMEKAVNTCFQSLFDHRVYVYMREHGFDAKDPRIAVVVQKQVASEIAGVGFSLNPITNYYDEAVFNANWGLGETVVSGLVTPDSFCVDKINGVVTKSTIGSKDHSMWLTPGGGTEKKSQFKNNERTLDDGQLIELTELIRRVESMHDKPMDIEWAYEKGTLYLLQARPITTYIPLSPEMLTAPGEKRRLYFDITVTAQAMNQPLTKMGTSLFRRLAIILGRIIFWHDQTKDITKSIPWMSDGKIYANFSNILKLAGKEKVLSLLHVMDPLGERALENADTTVYESSTSKFRLLPIALLWKLPGILLFLRRARKDPQHTHEWVQDELKLFETEAAEIAAKNIPLGQMFEELLTQMFYRVFRRTVPLTFYSRSVLDRMKEAVGNDPRTSALDRALSNNVTTEMGLALSRLAALVPAGMTASQLQSGLTDGTLPEIFLQEWRALIEKYGFRGPAEIDVGAPRYSDDPTLLIDLLLTSKNGESMEVIFNRNAVERRNTFEILHSELEKKNAKAAAKFEQDYRFFEVFGGYRETHKKYLVFIVALMREKIIDRGRALVMAGRLDRYEQVFNLTVDQLDDMDEETDLRRLAWDNTTMLRKLVRLKNPPTLIDSRGYIPQPPRPTVAPGEHLGMGVSAGIVRGRTKTLHTPDEKPLEKGEILVARATDPGWTPLFVNAAGIILEIGGSLQHGALVAREYGIPCVTGIEKATSLWKDGTVVEIDGSAGVVKTVEN